MTEAQRKYHARRFDKLMRALEEKYVVQVYEVLRRQIRRVSDELKYYGIDYARRMLDRPEWDQEMTGVIQKMYVTAGLQRANQSYDEIRRIKPTTKARTFGFNKEWTERIIQYFRIHLLESVNNISVTTRKQILSIIEQGQRKGWSVQEMVLRINDKLRMKNRAQTIVRTESVKAANNGVFLSAEVYDYVVDKEWISVNDRRRRASHAVLEGQVREVNEPFSNGLMFPGDPNGSADETINCRCNIVLVPRRDENGDLILKNN